MQQAMKRWCASVMMFGAVLIGGASPMTDVPGLALLRLFCGHAPMVTAELRFAVGLMGAVSLGWGASLLAVASTDLSAEVARPLWGRIGRAVLIWYLVDSTISIATGFWPNAVSNTVLAALFFTIQRRL